MRWNLANWVCAGDAESTKATCEIWSRDITLQKATTTTVSVTKDAILRAGKTAGRVVDSTRRGFLE
jgi:hypothetical protein